MKGAMHDEPALWGGSIFETAVNSFCQCALTVKQIWTSAPHKSKAGCAEPPSQRAYGQATIEWTSSCAHSDAQPDARSYTGQRVFVAARFYRDVDGLVQVVTV